MSNLASSLYQELNMHHYVSLVENILPNRDVLIALCDDSRQIIWANGDTTALSQFIAEGIESRTTCSDPENFCCTEHSHNGVSVLFCNLGEMLSLPAGELIFYGIEHDSEAISSKVASMLGAIAKLINSELNYLYEVNIMAGELGDRYDELSMLRSSDLEMNESRESRHILSTYIRSCADHLDVDYASIWVASRQVIYPAGVSYTHESKEVLALLENVSSKAYALFQRGESGFGINNQDETLRQDIQLPEGKKILLVPVVNSSGTPCGVLCCMNESHKKDFSNSDKETLTSVSRKTYKHLLRTEDELTGLLNRKGFEEEIYRGGFSTGSERHLVLFNIDQFKVVNAAYGMTVGDMVLGAVADALMKADASVKFVGRLDADVFAAVIEESVSEITTKVYAICNSIEKLVISIGQKNLMVKMRSGVVELNSEELSFSDYVYAAELAIASAKEEDNNRVVVYHPGNAALLKRQHQLIQVEHIKDALAEDRFELYCQRIQPLKDGKTHYEVLIRMIDEFGNYVFPDDFIPVAERYELMTAVDRWVVKNTFKLLTKAEYVDIAADYKWGVNLSGTTLGDVDFLEYVSDCMHTYDFKPDNLYFEITETAAIKNFQNCVLFMNKIHSLGVQFALDDFGSGLSSFSYLKKLSIDFLMIDGSLVKDIVSSRLDQTMVSSISDIANVLNVKTIAEYVENDLILKKLKSFNIDYAQGYGIMKPSPIEVELKSLIENSRCNKYLSN